MYSATIRLSVPAETIALAAFIAEFVELPHTVADDALSVDVFDLDDEAMGRIIDARDAITIALAGVPA